MVTEGAEFGTTLVDTVGLAELAVAVWRIDRRARRSPATPEGVLVACETARDRLNALGIDMRDLAGQPYDENMRVRVVQYDAEQGPARIVECLSPAIYWRNELIRPAEVTVEGEING